MNSLLPHNSLISALLSVEHLIASGHNSFKLFKQDSQWWVGVSSVEVNSKGVVKC
jgi:hypothetical protein